MRRCVGVTHTGDGGPPDDLAMAARALANSKRRAEYLRRQDKAAVLKARRVEKLPPGSRIWFALGLWRDTLRGAMLEHAWRRELDLAVATALVVEDPGQPPKRIGFVAGMNGAALASSNYISDPKHGCLLQYKRALKLPRALWISNACRDRYPGEVALIERLVRTAAGRTRWRLSVQQQVQDRVGLSASARQERVALVLQAELEAPALRQVLGKVTMADFVLRYARADTSHLQLGACGR